MPVVGVATADRSPVMSAWQNEGDGKLTAPLCCGSYGGVAHVSIETGVWRDVAALLSIVCLFRPNW